MGLDAYDVSIVIINKDEPALEQTLRGLEDQRTSLKVETLVVDASAGRLDHLRGVLPELHWIAFESHSGKRITIPEQRNVGVRAARAEVVAFIDSGCSPEPDWLDRLVGPILAGTETVSVGRTLGSGNGNVYVPLPDVATTLDEAPSINLAFKRSAFEAVSGFDEMFDYGSDIDFTWRLRQAGHRLRLVPDAVITHDWGTPSRQLKRAWRYGQARARIYRKHPREVQAGLRRDPILFAYPLYLLTFPLTLHRWFRWYPFLLLVPMWRARHNRPVVTALDHLAYGAGALAVLFEGHHRSQP